MKIRSISLLLATFSMHGFMYAQTLTFSGAIPGMVNRMAVADSLVFCAVHDGLQVLALQNDHIDPLSYTPLGASCNGIFVNAGKAFVLASEKGLQILDITDPFNPATLGGYIHPSGHSALAFSASGDLVAIAFGTTGMYFINVTDPQNPQLVSTFMYDEEDYFHDVVLKNGYCYAATGNKVRIINVADPVNPVYITYFTVQGEITDMDISGSKLLVLSNYNDEVNEFYGVTMVNVANPEVPLVQGTYDAGDYCYDITIDQNTCYLAAGTKGVVALGIGQTTFNQLFTFDTFTSHVISVTGNESYLVVSAEKSGLSAYHPGNMTPQLFAVMPVLYDTRDVAESNEGYIIAADGRNGLKMIDMNNISFPSIVASAANTGNGLSVVVNGSYAYLADGGDGLKEYRISSPEQFALTASVASTGWVQDLAVRNQIGYLAMDVYGIQLANLALPGIPSLVGTPYDLPGTAYGIDVSGNYAYVAALSAGLRVIDVSFPTALQEVATLQTGGQAYDVHIVENKAYIACSNAGFVIADISVPTSPSVLGSANPGGDIRQVLVKGNYAYLADWNGKVWVYNILNPATPYAETFYTLSSTVHNLALFHQSVVVANGSAGLTILANPFDTGTGFEPQGVSDIRMAFPNPASGEIKIPVSSSDQTCVLLFNVAGMLSKQYLSDGGNVITINTENLTDGVYFVKIISAERTNCQKIIIRH